MTTSPNDRVAGGLPKNLSACSALLCFSLLLGACHSRPAPVVAPVQPDSAISRLRQSVDSLLARPGLEPSTWGVLARSLTRNDTLYEANAGTLLIPASTLKVVTLAVAADQLGWDYSYETRLLGAGVIDEGVLTGDLLVVGSGDPSIDDWDGAATALFQEWAERLKGLGIHAVAGRLVGDDNSFDDEGLGAGWAWDDLVASYAAGIGALQFNQNTVRLAVVPGSAAGDASRVTTIPAVHNLTVSNLLTTGAVGEPTALSTRRVPGKPVVEVRGSLPLGSPALFRNVSVDNPTLYFGQTLRHVLGASGVDIRGSAADVDEIADAPSRTDAIHLFTHRSGPLSALAATMMKNSQNLYAETLLKTLGGMGTFDAGLRAVRATLESWGVAPNALRVADGSGLSRYNLTTAETLVTVLTQVHRDERLREPFHAALPLAGREGTLEQRLRGTPAENNARAKTGSLLNVRALTGYVRTADQEPLAFSIIANNFGHAAGLADETIDAIVVALAAFTRR